MLECRLVLLMRCASISIYVVPSRVLRLFIIISFSRLRIKSPSCFCRNDLANEKSENFSVNARLQYRDQTVEIRFWIFIGRSG